MKWKAAKALVFLGILLLLFFSPAVGELARFLNPEGIEVRVAEAGSLAPVLFILLMALAVVVSPIPTLPLDAAAGALFGPVLGTCYAVVGGSLGAAVAFLMTRLLGRGFLTHFIGGHFHFCSECSDKLLIRVVFVSRLIPFISFDIVSYGAGLTKMSLGRFVLATGLGMIPLTAVYTNFGSVLWAGTRTSMVLGLILVGLFVAFPRWIEKYNLFGLRHYFTHSEEDSSM